MLTRTKSYDRTDGRWRGRALLVGWVAPAALLAACSGGGSDASTTTTTTTAPTTTTTEVSLDDTGEAFQELIADMGDTIAAETEDRDGFAEDNDLEGAIESATGLQQDLEDFQAELADLEVPADEHEVDDALDELDDATSDYIDALAGYDDVTEVADYNDQLDEESDAASAWREAVADAADALDVDGLDDRTAPDDPTPPDDTVPPDDQAGPSGALIRGDGSEYCLRDGDLPDGFLPLAGKDNLSNALGYVFKDGPEADYAENLVASWMVLPEGGAGPTDLTADCVIHIFDSVDAAEGFYDAWISDYGSSSSPTPEPAEVVAGAPGEDPRAYTKIIAGRPDATQLFHYANVVVSVGITGTSRNNPDTLVAATNDLAGIVSKRLEAAG